MALYHAKSRLYVYKNQLNIIPIVGFFFCFCFFFVFVFLCVCVFFVFFFFFFLFFFLFFLHETCTRKKKRTET